jgi:hypothetical protein
VCRVSTVTSWCPSTTVGSLSESFDASISPAISTVAEFVTNGYAAMSTATVSVKLALSPAAIAPL